MNRLCAYFIIKLVFLFFLIASAFSKLSFYYYRCKDELFPLPSPIQRRATINDRDTYPAGTYPVENNISVPFLAEL